LLYTRKKRKKPIKKDGNKKDIKLIEKDKTQQYASFLGNIQNVFKMRKEVSKYF